MKLLIATSNLGKYRELQGLLRLPGVRLCWLADFPPVAPADEEGRSFAQNARLKAAHYHQLLRLPVVADDSGLQVERLGGQPGVHSARYAGVGAGDRENLEKLLRDLQRDLSDASR
ncbi:MAG: hypothetical protein HYX74_02055, partial [Acidobacteria bacterium]|nr:hypothetical protein [Acidobacteriota bacterium]